MNTKYLIPAIAIIIMLVSVGNAYADCYDYDHTNQTACEAAGCNWWDPWCDPTNCWDYGDSTTCGDAVADGCVWKTGSGE